MGEQETFQPVHISRVGAHSMPDEGRGLGQISVFFAIHECLELDARPAPGNTGPLSR